MGRKKWTEGGGGGADEGGAQSFASHASHASQPLAASGLPVPATQFGGLPVPATQFGGLPGLPSAGTGLRGMPGVTGSPFASLLRPLMGPQIIDFNAPALNADGSAQPLGTPAPIIHEPRADTLPTNTWSATDNMVTLDPDVEDLCKHFKIEEHHMWKLSKIMRRRPETFKEDMERLWLDLGRAKSPGGLLFTQMWEMEQGTFVGKTVRDKELQAMIKKFDIDELAAGKLADTLARFDYDKRCAWYQELERHFEVSAKPSAWAMKNLKQIGESRGDFSKIGKPGPPVNGSYLWKQKQKERDRSREKRRSRDRKSEQVSTGRERSRSRRRDKSRSRSRGKKKRSRS